MARKMIDAPFVGGMVTDLDSPGYALQDDQSTFAQDLIATRNVARQRRATETAGFSQVAGQASGLWKSDFVLAGIEDAIVVSNSGTHGFYGSAAVSGTSQVFTFGESKFGGSDVFGAQVDDSTPLSVLRATGTGTAPLYPSGTPVPRAMYNDEVLFVYDDGETPLWRYSGASQSVLYHATGTPYLDENASTVVATFNSNVSRAAYIYVDTGTVAPHYNALIEEFDGATEVALKNVLTTSGTTEIGTTNYEAAVAAMGRTFPCIPVYEAGVVTGTGTVVTGEATEWSDEFTKQDMDAISIHTNDTLGTSYISHIEAINGNESLDAVLPDFSTGVKYTINRCAPFKDVEVHKRSLWGTGVKEKPSSVWVAPPGWGLTEPPGFALPFDISAVVASSNFLDFQMDEIPVPVYADSDPIVALVSGGDALLVIKEDNLHAIYGAYPQFSQQKLADGVGCIDKRSAWSLPSGPFWAGRDGIYTFQGGQPFDITEGAINRQWRQIARGFDLSQGHYCTIGEVFDHLIVHVNLDATKKTFVFDMARKVWISEFSNFESKFYFTTSDSEYGEDMYFVPSGVTTGTIVRAAGAFYDTDSAPLDPVQPSSGFAPQFKAYTTLNLGDDFTRDQRMLDLGVDANVLDLSGTNTTVGIDHVGGGDFDHPASLTTTIGTITSDATDRLDYHHFRALNYPGRLHQLKFTVGTTNDSTDTIEIARITSSWRDNRSRA